MSPDEMWLTTVIELAVQNVPEGGSFGAVVVADGAVNSMSSSPATGRAGP